MSVGLHSVGTFPVGLDNPTSSVTNTTVTPGAAAVTVTGYAPTISRTENQTVSPASASVVVTGFAPTVTRTANQSVTPGAAGVLVTGFAPTITQAGSIVLTPDAASVVATGYAPTITQSTPAPMVFGGGGYVPSDADRRARVQRERERLGITVKAQQIIRRTVARAVEQEKTQAQADGILRTAMAKAGEQVTVAHFDAMHEARDKLLERDIQIAVSKKLQERRRRAAKEAAEEDDREAEMLLM